jgi:hypothetical protein
MPEAGGRLPGVASTFKAVGVYNLVKMMGDRVQCVEDTIIGARIEALLPVDDFILEYASGKRVYQHRKAEYRTEGHR